LPLLLPLLPLLLSHWRPLPLAFIDISLRRYWLPAFAFLRRYAGH
jgi:hypothetical protein